MGSKTKLLGIKNLMLRIKSPLLGIKNPMLMVFEIIGSKAKRRIYPMLMEYVLT
jgi:hypothetical protein